MTRVAEGKPAARRRAKRLLVRSAARPRRKIIWTELKRRAAARGFAPQELERFYHYLSTHLKLEEPEYVEPLQKPPNHFPGLRAQPVYDPSEFAWIPRLVDDFENIRQEVLDFSATLTLDAQPQGLTDQGRWSVLYFYAGGRRVEATTRACRRTSEIADSIPGAGRPARPISRFCVAVRISSATLDRPIRGYGAILGLSCLKARAFESARKATNGGKGSVSSSTTRSTTKFGMRAAARESS